MLFKIEYSGSIATAKVKVKLAFVLKLTCALVVHPSFVAIRELHTARVRLVLQYSSSI